jgi:hypothetical protein
MTRKNLMGSITALLTLTVICMASVAHAKAKETEKPTPIPVFVKAAQAADGFTDPDKSRTDSVKNLRDKLEDAKWLRLVDSEEEAVILLEVLGRNTEFDRGSAWNLVGGYGQKHSSVTVRLTAGSFTSEFTGTGGASGLFSGYGKAAGKVVDHLEKWVKENGDRLRATAHR